MAVPVAEMSALLASNNGCMPIGRLTHSFPGIKKKQIEEHFQLVLKPGGDARDLLVVLEGADYETYLAEQAASGGNKKATRSRANKPNKPDPGAPVAPLDQATVANVTAALMSMGGSMALGKLTRTCPGVKKASLLEHFYVTTAADGQAMVSLGDSAAWEPDAAADGTAAAAWEEGADATWQQPEVYPPVQQAAATKKPQDWAGAGAADKRAKVEGPELDFTKVVAIQEYLGSEGGGMALGKLCRQFPGVKRAQLEPHFTIYLADPSNPSTVQISIA